MNTTAIYNYQGNGITFLSGDSVMVNATEMAKGFNKRPTVWFDNQQTKDYLTELSNVRNLTFADLVQVKQGSPENGGGTWMHEDVAMEFARWLSPAFAIWCNDRIKELLTQGVVTASNDDEAILHAMEVLQKRVEESKQRAQMLEGERDQYAKEVKELAPKAQYTDEVLQSTSTFTATQMAKSLELSAVTFNRKLQELGIQFRQSGQWLLTRKYQDKGYAEMRVASYKDLSTNEIKTSQSLVWTEKGRQFLHNLRKEGRL